MNSGAEPRSAIPHAWEDEAANWIAWARTPGHDVFEYYAPAFFDEILPAPGGLTLEIGCGEGRVARALTACGHRVVAVDASPTLVRRARDADAGPAYLVADATALPFADAAFRTVVAYNSLQTMAALDDMAKAVREAGRVVEQAGRLCACMAHPMTDIGVVKEVTDDGEMVVAPSYFERRRVDETVTRDGLTMTFHGWTYTLEDYMRAFEDAGFAVERMREPVPGKAQGAERPGLERWRRIPLFLFIRAVKRMA